MSNKYMARNREIVGRYSNGESMKSLSNEFGISRERVRQIVVKSKKNIQNQVYYDMLCAAGQKYNFSDEIVYRLYNLLIRCGIFEKALTHKKKLCDYSDEELLSIFGFGKECLDLYKLTFRKEDLKYE